MLADLVADEFVYGRVQRVSREAPVLILEYDGAEVRLGGGANAVHNIHALGGTPLPLGVLGGDAHGRRLRALLRETGVATARVLTAAGYRTPVKTRILAGGAHSTKQQVVRIDRATRLDPKSPVRRAVRRALDGFRGRVDGVLVSDYGFGLLTPDLVQAACVGYPDDVMGERVCAFLVLRPGAADPTVTTAVAVMVANTATTAPHLLSRPPLVDEATRITSVIAVCPSRSPVSLVESRLRP